MIYLSHSLVFKHCLDYQTYLISHDFTVIISAHVLVLLSSHHHPLGFVIVAMIVVVVTVVVVA